MIKEIQKFRLILILFVVIAWLTEGNRITIDAKALIPKSEISFINPSLYYERKLSYENLIVEDKEIQSISNDFNQIIEIPDIQLKKEINRELGKTGTSDITLQELQSLSWLDLTNKNISNIEGLQYATNLEYLCLWGNQISDISPLGEGSFDNLIELDLAQNQISNISALGEGSFANLTHLYLYYNEISDISALGEGSFANLTFLTLWGNQISDISALGEGSFANLTYLYLDNNQISDISALGEGSFANLTYLYLDNNQISDISALGDGNFANLTYLDLDNNQISDISALGGGNFYNLWSLDLSNNQINDISALGDGNFDNLTALRLDNNQISNLSPLSVANFPGLKNLYLWGQKVILEEIEIYQGQSVKINNPILNRKGEYIIPTISNDGVYDYNQNQLIWNNIQQTQEVEFGYYNYSSHFSVLITIPIRVSSYAQEDINKDGIIDEQDLEFISQWYNITSDNSLWNLELDLNTDGIIDLFDFVRISNKIDN